MRSLNARHPSIIRQWIRSTTKIRRIRRPWIDRYEQCDSNHVPLTLSRAVHTAQVSSTSSSFFDRDAKQVWMTQADRQQLKDTMIPQSIRVNNATIRSLLQQHQVPKAMVMLHTMQIIGQRIHKETYNALLYQYTQRMHRQTQNSKQIAVQERILPLLEHMLATGTIDSRSFNTALVACSHANDLDAAIRVLTMMKDIKKRPGVFAFANVINCCASAKKLNDAKAFWHEMTQEHALEPTMEVVNCMLKVHLACGSSIQQTIAFVKAMEQTYGLEPDAKTTAMVFSMILKSEEKNAVIYGTQWMKKALELKIVVELSQFHQLLNRCRVEQKWKEAAELISLWRLSGCGMNAETQALMQLIRAHDDTPASWPKDPPTKKPRLIRTQSQQRIQRWIQLLEKGEFVQFPTNQTKLQRIVEHSDAEQLDALVRLLCAQPADDQHSSSQVLHAIIITLTRRGQTDKAIEILTKACKHLTSDDQSVCAHSVLASCGRQGAFDRALSLLRQLPSPSLVQYNACLNAAAVAGLVDQAIALFHEASPHHPPDRVSLNTVLKAFGSVSNWSNHREQSLVSTALAFYQNAMETYEIEPDECTHFLLVRAFIRAEMLDQLELPSSNEVSVSLANDPALAMQTIDHICRQEAVDVGVFNAAIDYCQRQSDVASAFEVYNVMQERSIRPNEATMTLLLTACGRAHAPDIGLTFLHHLMDENPPSITVGVMNGAIRMAAEAERMVEAMELLESMQNAGVLRPNADSYLHLIHACASVGDSATAKQLIDDMHRDQLIVPRTAYRGVLTACTSMDQAIESWHWMKQQKDFAPDVLTFHTLFKTLSRDEEEENEKGHGEGIHEVLWRWWDEMQSVYQVQPTPSICRLVLSICHEHHDFQSILQFFDAYGAQYAPDPDAILHYLDACIALKDKDRVLKLLTHLQTSSDHQTTPSKQQQIIMRLMDAFEGCGDWQQALGLLKALETDFGLAPDVTVFNRVLQLLNNVQEHQYVHRVFRTMQSYHVFPDTESYVQLIAAAEAMDQWVEATQFFMEMTHVCPEETLTPSRMERIAIGRYHHQRTQWPHHT